MPAYPNHQDIRPAYVTDIDPGAVGAGVFWFQPTAKFLAVRNEANDDWDYVLGFVETPAADPDPPILKQDIRYPDELNLLIHLSEGNF